MKNNVLYFPNLKTISLLLICMAFAGCGGTTTTRPEMDQPLLEFSRSPAADKAIVDYTKEYAAIIGVIETRAIRPVNFDRADSELAIEFLLRRLDPKHIVLKRDDVDRFKTLYGHENVATQGHEKLGAVIDAYIEFENDVLNNDVLRVLPQLDTQEHPNVDVEKEWHEWAESESDWHNRLNEILTRDVNFYRGLGYSDKEVVENLTVYYQRIFGQTRDLPKNKRFELIAKSVAELVDSNSDYFWTNRTIDLSSFSMEGIGMVLSETVGIIKVERLLMDGPADRTGNAEAGDFITGVSQDGEVFAPTFTLSYDDVIKQIRGPVGSLSHLEIAREGKRFTVAIPRGRVLLQEQQRVTSDIKTHVFDDRPYRIGVIVVPSFYIDFQAFQRRDPNYPSSVRDATAAMRNMREAGVDAVVFDLRNNGGGALQQGIAFADVFIDSGTLLQLKQGQQDKIKRSAARTSDSGNYEFPKVFLVNEQSAGATEILVGTIQDYGAGLVVGRQTFGLGVVQALHTTHYGSVKISESQYFRVTGEAFQTTGVLPDIEIQQAEGKPYDAVGERFKNTVIPRLTVPAASYQNLLLVNEPLVNQLKMNSVQRQSSTFIAQQADNGAIDRELYEALNIAADFYLLKN